MSGGLAGIDRLAGMAVPLVSQLDAMGVLVAGPVLGLGVATGCFKGS